MITPTVIYFKLIGFYRWKHWVENIIDAQVVLKITVIVMVYVWCKRIWNDNRLITRNCYARITAIRTMFIVTNKKDSIYSIILIIMCWVYFIGRCRISKIPQVVCCIFERLLVSSAKSGTLMVGVLTVKYDVGD